MRADVLDVRIDADAIQDGLTHWVWDNDPDGPTFCGLASVGMRDVTDTDIETDCPLCIAADEALEDGGAA
jgi:hypothetical protein